MQYGQVVRNLQLHTLSSLKPVKRTTLANYWYHGQPGTGKSTKARERYPDTYEKPLNKWWDCYQGQACALLDDFAPCHNILATHLLRWADLFVFTGEVKGGHITIRPATILVTSNYTIAEAFADQP